MSNQRRLSDEQEAAIEIIEHGQGVFLTGKAGSGKSTVIQEFMRRTKRNVICVAPTGVAACNIDGTTIHSAFGLPTGLLIPETIQCSTLKQGQMMALEFADTIIVEEVSMVRSDLLWGMDMVLRNLVPPKMKKLPFGGKQVVVVGDFCQLPPVVADRDIEMNVLHSIHGGIYAFQSQVWRDLQLEPIYLKNVHRQCDKKFLEIVNAIRQGETSYWAEHVFGECWRKADYSINTENSYLNMLNKNCVRKSADNSEVVLCCNRRDVRMINKIGLERLKDTGIESIARVKGVFPPTEFPTDARLRIKRGAKVMLLKNKQNPNGVYEYVNGDVGTVIDYENGDNPKVKIQMVNGREIVVGREEWSHEEYGVITDSSGQQQIITEVVGNFYQLPLINAFAMTIHKAQGKTLNGVRLSLGYGCFAPGQLYTALTRVRSINDLILSRPIYEEDVIIDPVVQMFYEKFDQTESPWRSENYLLKYGYYF